MILLTSRLLPSTAYSHWLIIAVSAGYTVFVPLAFIAIARMAGFVSEFQMHRRKDRIFSLLVTCGCAFSFSYVLGGWHAPVIIRSFVSGSAAMLLITALISTFSRISLHTIGWGGLTALVSYLSFAQPDLSWILAFVVVMSGLVGTARIYLEEHSPRQVYLGFLLGFVTIWSTFIINQL